MTPTVIDKPDASSPLLKSTEGVDGLCVYLEDRDPFALLEPLGTSRIGPPSSCLESVDFSLWSFRPKNDLPPEDWRDLLSTGGVVEGMSHRMVVSVNAGSAGTEPSGYSSYQNALFRERTEIAARRKFAEMPLQRASDCCSLPS